MSSDDTPVDRSDVDGREDVDGSDADGRKGVDGSDADGRVRSSFDPVVGNTFEPASVEALDPGAGEAFDRESVGASGAGSDTPAFDPESPAASLDEEFALCLTHDVDRPFKRAYQAVYYGVRERRLRHLWSLLPGRNPYWQFGEIMDLEADLGVRSAFYFLNAPPLWDAPPREWLRPTRVIEHLGRYDPRHPEVAEVVRRLEAGGWEVGLHGSLDSAYDGERLATEYRRLESVVEGRIVGCRQHHLRLVVPRSLANQAALGLKYDASLGPLSGYGYQHGHGLLRPLSNGPLVFPLTVMEMNLPDPGTRYPAAWAACERLLRSARANDGVMTVLWHPRYLNEGEFPGYRRLYRRLVERAQEMGAWVGPPRDLLEALAETGVETSARTA